MITMIKSYSELIKIFDYNERFDYLQMNARVSEETFGSRRYLNQMFYQSPSWRSIRREVILRDDGCDLAHKDHPIGKTIYVHHINPITIDDVLEDRDCLYDLENLISVSFNTHNAIHYGTRMLLQEIYTPRSKNDTKLW